MKVIQITDEDCKQLLQDLKLEKLDPKWGEDGRGDPVSAAHRAFHYHVTTWLIKHGANLA